MEIFSPQLIPPAYRALADQVARARKAREDRVNVLNQSYGFGDAKGASQFISEADRRAQETADALDTFQIEDAIPDFTRVNEVARQFEDAAMQTVAQPVRQMPTLGIGEAIAGLAGALIDPRGSGRGFDALRGITQQRNEIEFANEVARYQEDNARRQAILDALGQRMTTEQRIADADANRIDRNNRTNLQRLQGAANVAQRGADSARTRVNDYNRALGDINDAQDRTLRDILTNAANQAKIAQGEKKIAQADKRLEFQGKELEFRKEREKAVGERFNRRFDQVERQFGLKFNADQKQRAFNNQMALDDLELARKRLENAQTDQEFQRAKFDWERQKFEYEQSLVESKDEATLKELTGKLEAKRRAQFALKGDDAKTKEKRQELELEIAELDSLRSYYRGVVDRSTKKVMDDTDAFIDQRLAGSGTLPPAETAPPGGNVPPPPPGGKKPPLRGNIGGNRPNTNQGGQPKPKPKPKPPAKPNTQKTSEGYGYKIKN